MAQDVMYTQYGYYPEGSPALEQKEYFEHIMSQVRNFNGRDPKTTRQGFYAFDASGRVYGAMNSRRASRLLRILDRALDEYRRPSPPLSLGPVRGKIRPEPPDDGAVVRVISRIQPVPEGSQRRNQSIGRDFLWITGSELAALRRGEFPAVLAGRILRFHLIDNVRGEPDPWALADVKRAEFSAQRRKEGVTVSGRFRLERPGQERTPKGRRTWIPDTGYEGRLDGSFTFDEESGRVTKVALLAEGEAWGRGRYNPGEPRERFPLKIAFVLSTDPADRKLPPGMYFHGGEQYWLPAVPITSLQERL